MVERGTTDNVPARQVSLGDINARRERDYLYLADVLLFTDTFVIARKKKLKTI